MAFVLSSAQRSESCLPFSTSIVNQMISEAAVQIANRNGNPIQLFPVLLMMAWMTLGPIMEEAQLERPNSPKTVRHTLTSVRCQVRMHAHTMLSKPGGVSYGLSESIIRCLEDSENDIISP